MAVDSPTNVRFFADYVDALGNDTLQQDFPDNFTTLAVGASPPTASGGRVVYAGAGALLTAPTSEWRIDGVQTGCVRIRWAPQYAGSPATLQTIFLMSDEIFFLANMIRIEHNVTGDVRIQMTDEDNANIIPLSVVAAFSPTSGQLYEFEFNYDVTAGVTSLHVDGVQLGSTFTQTGTRSPVDVNLFTQGSAGIVQAHEIEDTVIFDAVQHQPADDFATTLPRVYNYVFPTACADCCVYGWVCGSDGEPVANATVEFTPSSRKFYEESGPNVLCKDVVSTTTDDLGLFQQELLEGEEFEIKITCGNTTVKNTVGTTSPITFTVPTNCTSVDITTLIT